MTTVDFYDKEQSDALLDAKADKSSTYTKTEVDTALGAKANSADVYTKSEADTLLGAKANSDDVYTKNEVNDALALKADKSYVDNFGNSTIRTTSQNMTVSNRVPTTTTNSITVPATGNYIIIVNAKTAEQIDQCYADIGIFYNGRPVEWLMSSSNANVVDNIRLSASALRSLNANSIVTVQVYHNNSSNVSLTYDIDWSITRV